MSERPSISSQATAPRDPHPWSGRLTPRESTLAAFDSTLGYLSFNCHYPPRNHPRRAFRAALDAPRHLPARRGPARTRAHRWPADHGATVSGGARRHTVAPALPLPARAEIEAIVHKARPVMPPSTPSAPVSARRSPQTARWAGSATGSRRKRRARRSARRGSRQPESRGDHDRAALHHGRPA